MIPSVAPMPDGTGGPIFNGPHAADPSWNSLIKMVSNSTENGPQTVSCLLKREEKKTFCGNVILK